MNCLRIARRKGCTIGLELAEDMTVADIVRNAPRTGTTARPTTQIMGSLPLGLEWRGLARDLMTVQGVHQIEPCRVGLQDHSMLVSGEADVVRRLAGKVFSLFWFSSSHCHSGISRVGAAEKNDSTFCVANWGGGAIDSLDSRGIRQHLAVGNERD